MNINKKKRVYLHIGTHKTGTTTIQKKLKEYKRDLAKEGFSVIAIPNKLKGLMTISDHEEISFYSELLSDVVGKENDNEQNIIISWEGFSGNYYNGYNNSNLIAEVVKNCFPTELYDVNVIIYLRAQDSFIESLYTQEIHAGGDCNFHEFCSTLNIYNDFDWANLISSYTGEFGKANVIVKAYSRERLQKVGGLLFEFSQIINSHVLQSVSEIKNENVGFNRGALELARKVNKDLNPTQRKQLRSLLHSISEQRKYSFFSLDERNKIIERYDEINNNIFVLHNTNDNMSLFDRDISSDDSKENELSALTKVILKINADYEEQETNFKELSKNATEIEMLHKKINELSTKFNELNKKHSNLLNSKLLRLISLIEVKIKRILKK